MQIVVMIIIKLKSSMYELQNTFHRSRKHKDINIKTKTGDDRSKPNPVRQRKIGFLTGISEGISFFMYSFFLFSR